jgi:hypothetical protein
MPPKGDKKKKKKEKKVKEDEKKINEIKNIDITPNIFMENRIESPLQIINNINTELDSLSNKLNINRNLYNYETNIYSFSPLINDNNYFYDKEDLEIKNLLYKANLLLNNNTHKDIIKNYENKIVQPRNHPYYYNSQNVNNGNVFSNNNNLYYKSNMSNRNNINQGFNKNRNIKHQIRKFYSNENFNKNNYKKKNFHDVNDYNNYNKRKIKNFHIDNSFEQNIHKRTKKLEGLNLNMNNYKRKPMIYSQPDSTNINNNIKRRNSTNGTHYKLKEKYRQYLRTNDNNERAIDILKAKI